MTWIAIIGPMGSGKTTLMHNINEYLKFDVMANRDHEVFDWPMFKGHHDDNTFAHNIQTAIVNNHFHQIFGHFMKDGKRNTISDSAFMEHIFYNNTKHRVGKYHFSNWYFCNQHRDKLAALTVKPNLVIRVKTSPQQTVHNIVTRNRHFETEERDTTDLLNYITILTEEYDKYDEVDIVYEFGGDIKEVLEAITLVNEEAWNVFKGLKNNNISV